MFEVLEELQEGSKNYETLQEYLDHSKNVIDEVKVSKSSQGKRGVVLSTMHSAKGLEFETVFLPSVVEGVVPHERSKTDEEIEEERRMLYVAMTRAKSQIYLSIVKNRHEKNVKVTPFLKSLIKE